MPRERTKWGMTVSLLEGVKVLDLTHYIAGSFCAQILADHGAEVIKIEPASGPNRKSYPVYKGFSLYYAAMNRNKRGIVLDLKSSAGREVLHRMVRTADVLVTNYSLGVPEKLGFGYEEISKINPRIIMTHITGFGLTGPRREKNAYDGIIQGMSGLCHLTGYPDGPPLLSGVFVADHVSGIQGALGTMLALYARTVTGKGQLVDVSMLDSVVSMLIYHLSDAAVRKNSPMRTGNRLTNTFAPLVPVQDGWIMIAPLTEQMWTALCRVVGRQEWTDETTGYLDPYKRLDDYEYLEREIAQWSRQRTKSEALDLLEAVGVPCRPVLSIEEIIEDPQLNARGMILPIHIRGVGEVLVPGVPIKFGSASPRPVTPPPHLGEHTKEVLEEYGYSEDEIRKLLEERVVSASEN